MRLIRISANELIAGAPYIGEWQERARHLVRFGRDTGAIIAMGDPNGREIERAVIRPLARLSSSSGREPGDLIRLHPAGKEQEIALEVHRVREPRPLRRAAGPSDGGPTQATLGRLATQVRQLVERIDAGAAGPVPVAVEEELSRLLDASNAPGFWDDPDAARRALALALALSAPARHRRLARRARPGGGLVQLASQMRARRIPAGSPSCAGP